MTTFIKKLVEMLENGWIPDRSENQHEINKKAVLDEIRKESRE